MDQFQLDISKFAEKVEGRLDEFMRGVCMRAYTGIVMKNPVDTGRSQNNWNVGINNVDSSVTSEGNKDKSAVIRAAQNILRRIKGGDVIWITNNVDYIEYLEDGSSDKAPNGMVAITLRELPGIVTRSVVESKKKHP
jgi:hypothetical protein